MNVEATLKDPAIFVDDEHVLITLREHIVGYLGSECSVELTIVPCFVHASDCDQIMYDVLEQLGW